MKRTQITMFVLAIVGSLILLNVISLGLFGRLDLTRDKLYTLSAASRESVGSLEDPITITAYFTENLPPPYAGNARYVKDLLQEFRAASKGRVGFEFVDPSAQETADDKEKRKEVKRDVFGRSFREPTSVEKELASSGVQPVEIRVVEEDQVQTKRAYMGLVLRYREKTEVLPVVQDTRNLEYDLTTLIRKLARPKVAVLGLAVPKNENRLDDKFNKLETLLSQQHEVRRVNLATLTEVPADMEGLIILGITQAVPEPALRAIDQFLMKGKSVALFPDAVKVDLRTFEPQPAEHNLAPLLATYGVKLGDQLVADVKSAQLNVQERRGFMIVNMPVTYPFVPQLQRLEGDSAVSRGLSNLVFPFVTSVSLQLPDGTQGSVLAKSSPKSWLEPKPFNINPRRDWRSETVTPVGSFDLMVQVSGKLKSHFAALAQSAQSPGAAAPLAESQGDARLIVAGGSALAMDDFLSPSNQALMLNVADWMLLDPAMLAMRARQATAVPLESDLRDALRNGVKYGNVIGVPLLLVVFGVVRWRRRERTRRLLATA